MRRLSALPCLALLAACASMGAPPGGPPDKAPPRLVTISPDSAAVNFHGRGVIFNFDETVSDRISQGTLAQYFIVSPSDGAPRVSYHRDRIEVRPRRGFKGNTAYSITLLPGLSDIRGNAMKEGRTVVFATGPDIPRFGILGRVFDWGAERAAPFATVMAISRPDSTVYIGAADSTGAFNVGPLPAGTYHVIGWLDQNRNRARDGTEIWDSTTVVVSQSRPLVELLAIARDTIGPRLQTVASEDSLTLRLTFDRALDPRQQLATAQFRLVRPDSSSAAILSVATLAEVERAKADSIRKLDTARARADSAAGRVAPGTGRAVAQQQVKPPLPPPPTVLVVKLAPTAILRPSTTYRMSADRIRSVTGKLGSSTRAFTTPRPDTARAAPRAAPADTARQRPVPRPPTPTPTPVRPPLR